MRKQHRSCSFLQVYLNIFCLKLLVVIEKGEDLFFLAIYTRSRANGTIGVIVITDLVLNVSSMTEKTVF